VSVRWQTPGGASGWGSAVQVTRDSGYFYFFEPENLELMVKVLDGRSLNGSFWVFYGALSPSDTSPDAFRAERVARVLGRSSIMSPWA